MSQSDLDYLVARTQRQLAFVLVTGLLLIILVVLTLMVLPVTVNDKFVTLGVTVATGLLGLAGSVVAYFFARHRPPTAADDDDTPDSTVSPPTKQENAQ